MIDPIRLADLIDQPIADVSALEGLPFRVELLQGISSDDFATDHYQHLTHDLIPAGSFFLERKGMLGGSVAFRVQTKMMALGYTPETDSLTSDHLSNVLRFSARLHEQGEVETLNAFLSNEVHSWLPFVIAEFELSGSVFFEDLAGVLKQWLRAGFQGDGVRQVAPEGASDARATRQGLFDVDLDFDKADLVGVSRFLATPIESGVFISKSRLASEARSMRLPMGFGSRSMLIEGMLRSASQYDALPKVCSFLDAEVTRTMNMWQLAKDYGVDVDSHWQSQWRRKLNVTAELITTMRSV